MSLQISNLAELDPAKVATMVATMAQLMQERHPEVELTRGVFHDLVLYFNGVLNAAVQENIDRILASNSLLKIVQNPALADDALADQVLANYNITRDIGTPATGFATFVFATPLTTRLPSTGLFQVNNVSFTLNDTFTIVPSKEDVVTETDRAMVEVGDGTYVVTLPMTATTIGVDGNVKRGTTIRANFTPDNVLRVYAASDFISGRDPITNADYLKKLTNGLAAKTIGGRKSYDAFIRAQKEFENILHVSVLGCGDPEQHRDQHSLFPISGGGRVDVYIQTNHRAQEVDHNVQATFVRKTSNGTLWQIILPRDLAPGFYDVVKILPPPTNAVTQETTSGSYEIVEDIRNFDLLSAPYVADIQTVPESAFTRYQTSVIRFEDTDKIGENLIPNRSTAFYTLTTRGLPLIGDIHDFLTSRDNRARGTDILVKAAIPCFTNVSFAIHVDSNDFITADTIAAMKKAVVAAIANVGFSGQLHASLIAGAAHKFLTGRQAINEIDMFGKILRPDGSATYLRDNTLLTIPTDPARMVTGRTTAFLTGVEAVEITVVTAGYTN
jgi:hypothetical protein